jgi:hypothetical protein
MAALDKQQREQARGDDTDVTSRASPTGVIKNRAKTEGHKKRGPPWLTCKSTRRETVTIKHRNRKGFGPVA